MFKKISSYIFLISIIFSSGCVTLNHKPLSPKDSQSIKSVYVNPEIKKSAKMYELTHEQNVAGMALGPVGVLASAALKNHAESTQEFSERNKIDIRNIVYQRWKKQIKNRSGLKLEDKPADTVLITEIPQYGISIPHGFSAEYVPVLTLNAKLVRNNQVIWQESGLVLPLTRGMPRYKMNAILEDPQKLRIMWDKAAEKIINEMLVDINK